MTVKAGRRVTPPSGSVLRGVSLGLSLGLATLSTALAQTNGGGTLTLNAGTALHFTGGNGTIANNITVSGDPDFVVSPSTTQTVSGVISDGASAGTVAASGGGTLVLSGANTYSGGTMICGTTCGAAGGSTTLQVTNSTPGTSSSIGTGTLTLDGGTFQGPSAGSVNLSFSNPVQLTSNGGVIDSNGNTLQLTGGITDAPSVTGGTLTLQDSSGGNGITTLSGSSTYTGTTAITNAYVLAGSTTAYSPNSAFQVGFAGTLAIGGYNNTILSLADGLGGGGDVQNDGGTLATLTIDGGSGVTTTFSGSMRDGELAPFALAKDGASTQILTGSSPYSGGTTVLDGILVAANASALGTGGVTVQSGGTLNVDGVTIPNTLMLTGSGFGGSGTSGPGALSGTGTAEVDGAVTLGGNTLVGVAAAGDTLTLTGVIDDGDNGYTLMKNGAGTLTLTGANTYTGATEIAGGTLAIGAGGSIASSASVQLSASTAFDISAGGNQSIGGLSGASGSTVNLGVNTLTVNPGGISWTFSGVIQGTGGLSLSGSAGSVLLLQGTNTYTGTTTIGSGTTLALVGNGSTTTGSIASQSVSDNGTLTFNHTDSVTYGGAISGSGAVQQNGTGTVTLTGNSSGFTGTTTVSSGILEVGDASHASATLGGNVSVASGGTLMGHGTIGGNVGNFGTVQPGGTIGILSVTGNYTQASTATLNIEITPNVSAGPGVGYDQLSVTGSATLAGTLAVLDDAGTYTVGSRYTILTAAGGRSGTFTTVNYNPAFAAYIVPEITYDADNVYLTLDPTQTGMNSAQQVPDALTEMLSAIQGVGDAVLADVCGPEAQRLAKPGEGCVRRPTGTGYQTELWLRGIGGLGSLTGSGTRVSFHDDYAGTLIGAGVGRGGFTVGAGAGYLATALNFSDGSNATQSAGLGFVYGRYADGPWRLGMMASYGAGMMNGTRELPGTGLAASGNRAANFAIVQSRAAYDVTLGPVILEPRMELAYLHAGQDGFSETGAGMLNLNYSATHADEAAGRLVVRATQHFMTGTWALAPWLEAGAQETFCGLARTVLVTDGTVSGSAAGVSPAPASGLVGAGLSAAASDALNLFIRYQGQFAANQIGNTFSAGATYRF